MATGWFATDAVPRPRSVSPRNATVPSASRDAWMSQNLGFCRTVIVGVGVDEPVQHTVRAGPDGARAEHVQLGGELSRGIGRDAAQRPAAAGQVDGDTGGRREPALVCRCTVPVRPTGVP